MAEAGAGTILAATAPAPGWEAWLTGAVVIGALVALLREVGSPDQVLLGAFVVLIVSGVVVPERALRGFADPAMLTVGALFVVAAAVRKSGALTFLEGIMMPRSRRLAPALARLMLPSSFLSLFLNNTPIVAFLTPMVQDWGRRAGIPASKLLIPLSYATILGGMATLIGTSTNLVVSSLLESDATLLEREDGSARGFGMFELAWIGLPAAIVGFLYLVFVGHRLLPESAEESVAVPARRRSYQFDLLVPEGSPIAGRSIEEGGLRALEDAFLAHIRRGGVVIGPVGPEQTVVEGDVLTFIGDAHAVDALLQSGQLSRVVELPGEDPDVPNLPLYEAVVAPSSRLVGKSLRDSGFRELFQGVVLGIHRGGQRLEGAVGQAIIEPGDLLLIEARPSFPERWLHGGEFYLVAPLDREDGQARRRAHLVLAILLATVTVVALGWMPMVTAAFGAAALVVLVGAVNPNEARRSVDLSVLVVIASAFGIGHAIEATGLAEFLAAGLIGLTAGLGVLGALAAVYLSTNLLTEVLTNSVAAVLLFPIGMAVADGFGAEYHRAFAVAIAVAASAGFATPIGYQTNLMVMSPGGYRFIDYVRVGAPLNLLIFALAMAVIPAVWM